MPLGDRIYFTQQISAGGSSFIDCVQILKFQGKSIEGDSYSKPVQHNQTQPTPKILLQFSLFRNTLLRGQNNSKCHFKNIFNSCIFACRTFTISHHFDTPGHLKAFVLGNSTLLVFRQRTLPQIDFRGNQNNRGNNGEIFGEFRVPLVRHIFERFKVNARETH